MEAAQQIVQDCVALLEQGAAIVARINDNVFATTSPISPRGSIGGHLRHVLDFYRNFLSGLQHERVDYNRRERNVEWERKRTRALEAIHTTIRELQSLEDINSDTQLWVSTESGSSWSRSSVMRELDLLKSHTIHHYSLIAMLLRMHEIDPGEDFGVAPSTLEYWKQEAACAR